MADLRRLEINGGRVEAADEAGGRLWRFVLPPVTAGYADAQIDDYGRRQGGRAYYPWRPGLELRLQARFSHPVGQLQGTAGFGFWNAPFGDPTVRWPALPQAVWFFYASEPTDLPLAPDRPGRGWFAATLDAGRWPALRLIPLAPLILLLNQFAGLRRRIWPAVRQQLGVSYYQLDLDITQWRAYRLSWQPQSAAFWVDDQLLLLTPHSPRGPLGFVCWLDNQSMVATPRGRFAWRALTVAGEQWMEVKMEADWLSKMAG